MRARVWLSFTGALLLLVACGPSGLGAPTGLSPGGAATPTSAAQPARSTSTGPAATTASTSAGPAATTAPATNPRPTSEPPTGAAPTIPPPPINAVTTPTAAAESLVHLKGAYSQSSSVQGALYVARELGFFTRHGLDVELARVGGPAQVAALLSGEIQFGALGANEVANADLGGANLVMIATCSDLPIFSLYASPQYATVQDLAGQSIGVTGPGSATDATAHLFLKHFGLLDKVRIVAAGGTIPGILAAMTQGVIAGGILSPPTTAQAESAGYHELVNGASLGVPMNHSGIAVSRAYLQGHADEVRRFLAAYQQAWTFSADPAHKAEVVEVLQHYTDPDPHLAEVGYQAMVPVWSSTRVPSVSPEGVANLLSVSPNPAAQTARPEQFIDNSLIESVQSAT